MIIGRENGKDNGEQKGERIMGRKREGRMGKKKGDGECLFLLEVTLRESA